MYEATGLATDGNVIPNSANRFSTTLVTDLLYADFILSR